MKRLIGFFDYYEDEGKMYYFKLNEQGCITDNQNKITIYPISEHTVNNWNDINNIIRGICATIILNTQVNEIEQIYNYSKELNVITIQLIGE